MREDVPEAERRKLNNADATKEMCLDFLHAASHTFAGGNLASPQKHKQIPSTVMELETRGECVVCTCPRAVLSALKPCWKFSRHLFYKRTELS